MILAGVAGCYHPSAANNKLRGENQDLRDKITDLERRHAGDEATIRALEQKQGTPPQVSSAKVDQLFTVHGIRIGRLTGGDDWDPSKPGQDGLKVAVELTDDDGEKLKSAGTIVVDAFDLAAEADKQIGHWTFDAEQARQSWLGSFLYCYVLKCPWQKPPAHREITVRVSFTDLLTGRQFTQQKTVKVEPPPPPTSEPATKRSSTQARPAP